MTKYEILYVISPSVSEQERETLIKKFSTYVTKNNGSVANIDKWGLKKLAYPIKFKTEGFYVLMNYECDSNVSSAMEKLMLITEGILRLIIVKK